MGEKDSTYTKPLPALEGLTEEFYRWCAHGELRFQRCTDCQAWRHVPRELCAECGSWQWQWARSSGRGTVFSWTVVERPLAPAFAEDLPYACVVVEMEEGVRILTQIADCSPERLAIGMPVEVAFDAVTAQLVLPKFRRSPG